MPQKIVYYIPGILGSEMFQEQPVLENLLWVNKVRLALGHTVMLKLGPGGIQPDPDGGETCYPGEPLAEYYGEAAACLQRDLGSGWTVIPFGYDWRKDLSVTGRRLSATIRAQGTSDNPVSIVAHSQGGLIARMAWYGLAATSEQGLIRRIVTIGTPHEGCYAPNAVFVGRDEVIDQIRLAETFTAGLAQLAPVSIPSGLPHSPSEIAAVCASWPALFQLMPVVNPQTLEWDPWRNRNYNREAWLPALQGRTQWLDYASGPWRAILNSTQSKPTSDILIAIGAIGFDTAFQLKGSGNVQDSSSYVSTSNGDGRVDINSAIPWWATGEVVYGKHGDLMRRPEVLGKLAEWVRREISPQPPVGGWIPLQPPLVYAPPGPIVEGPPFTRPPALWFDP